MQQGNSPRKWNMADRVEAFHKKFNDFRPGKIVAVHKSTGLFDVSFDEGGESLDISPELIRGIGSNSQNRTPVKVEEKPATAYKVGDQIEANRESKGIWRYAVIAKVYPDKFYDVVYTDRFRENHISPDLVRGLYDSAEQFAPAMTNHNLDIFADPSGNSDETTIDDVCLGMIVEARYHGGKQYFTGTITRLSKHSNTVDILYEDGDAETFLPVEFVRLIPGKSIMNNNRSNESSDPVKPARVMSNEDPMFTVGLAVEGNFQGKNRWYPGIVTRVRTLEGGEFRYAIRYNDGDSEENVPEHMLRMPKLRSLQESHDAPATTASASPVQSTQASSNNANSSPSSPATGSPLKARRLKQTEDTPQSSGNIEQQQPPVQKKHHHHHHKNSKKPTTAIPDAQYMNRDDHANEEKLLQNLHASLDDDDRPEPILSTKMAGDLHIGTASGSTPTAKAKKHHKHHHHHHKSDKDEQPQQMPAQQRSNPSGNNAAPQIVRPQQSQQISQPQRPAVSPGRMLPQELDTTDNSNNASNPKKKPTANNAAATNGVPLSSIRIEANFRGKGVWFPGRLLRERDNGTVDVLYDDGDQELGVPVTHIRPMHSAPNAVSLVPPTSTAVPQKTTNTSNNSKNNVDNGSSIIGVADTTAETRDLNQQQQHKHHHHHRNKPTAVGEFSVGDRVIADYRNQGQMYPGLVKRLHSHGLTVDILYDDGDVEKKVPIDRVQKLDAVTTLTTSAKKQSRPTTATASATQPSQPTQQRPLTAVSPTPSSSAAIPTATAVFPASEATDLQLQQQLALNSNDVAALREYIRRKDAEIDRLRQTVSQLTTSPALNNGNGALPDGKRAASSGGVNRPGRQYLTNNNNGNGPNNNNAPIKEGDDATRTPHAPVSVPRPSRSYQNSQSNQEDTAGHTDNNHTQPVADEGELRTQQEQQAMIEQLIRANEELKRSVAFLGQKFTMVVEELVRVKSHEEKLVKHVKKHGEVLKRLYQQDRRLHGHHHSSHGKGHHDGEEDEEETDQEQHHD